MYVGVRLKVYAEYSFHWDWIYIPLFMGTTCSCGKYVSILVSSTSVSLPPMSSKYYNSIREISWQNHCCLFSWN